MGATVYGLPEELEASQPRFDDFHQAGHGFDSDAYFGAIADHKATVAKWCRDNTANPRSPLIGETIRFPVGDGYAEYMVYTTTPLALIHLPYGDAWHVDPIMLRGLRVADVKQKVGAAKKLDELFGRS
jgi:hypothetical protein